MDLKSNILCNAYQRGIFFHWKENPFSEAYRSSIQYKIDGELNSQLLMQSCQNIFSNHYVFGLKFRECANGKVVFMYDCSCLPVLQLHTIECTHESDIQHQLDLYKDKFFLQQFNLIKGKTLYIDLVRINNSNTHYLFIKCHNIICDTDSFHELIRLISVYYNDKKLPSTKDIISSACKYVSLNEYTRQFDNNADEFSRKDTGKFRHAHMFPVGFDKTQKSSYEYLAIATGIKSRINRMCSFKNISPNIFYLGCYQIFMNIILRKEKICTGISISNRSEKKYRNVIGHFVNTLQVTTAISPDMAIDDFFQNLKIDAFNLIKNRIADLKLLFNDPEKQFAAQECTFDNFFVFHKGSCQLNLSGNDVKPLQVQKKHQICPFNIMVEDETDGSRISFIYENGLVQDGPIKNIFLRVIHEVLSQDNRYLADIRLALNKDRAIYMRNTDNATGFYLQQNDEMLFANKNA